MSDCLRRRSNVVATFSDFSVSVAQFVNFLPFLALYWCSDFHDQYTSILGVWCCSLKLDEITVVSGSAWSLYCCLKAYS